MTLGERLAHLRLQAGMSQEVLAETIGVSRQSVSKWETDASVPDLERLVTLSALFDVSLDDLVRGGPAPPRPSSLDGWCWRIAARYREKGYLLGWALAAWGVLGLLQSLWTVLTMYLPAAGIFSAVDFFFRFLLFGHIADLSKMAFGALVVLRGQRLAGRLRAYHLGWVLIFLGLYGIPLLPPFRSGPLSLLIITLFLFLPAQGLHPFLENLPALLAESSGASLLCVLGGAILFWGKKQAKRTFDS